MGGNVYLRTDRFEVKLEGIRFKPKDFEYLCSMDFLFPGGKIWDRPPVVGLDVMRHPRDPSILLVLLCFGVGCVILRFVAGEPLPAPICKFLSDKRIHFVGFGIPEKKELFPFKEFGLTKDKVDIGYMAAKILKQPKCKKWELGELARKVLGIKKMVGLTDASSSERHEQIKCAICQLFVTSLIAMALLRADDKKKLDVSPKKRLFLKHLNSLHCLAEGWFKGKKKNDSIQVEEEADSIRVHIGELDSMLCDDFLDGENPFGKIQEDDVEDDYSSHPKVDEYPSVKDVIGADGKEDDSGNNCAKDVSCTAKMALEGIKEGNNCAKDVSCKAKTTLEGIKEGSSGNNLAKDVCCTAKMPSEGIKEGNNCAKDVSCTAKVTVEGIKEGSSGNNLAKDVCCTAKMPSEGIKEGNNCAKDLSCTAKVTVEGIKEGSSGNNLAKDVSCTAKMTVEGIKEGNNCAKDVSCTAKMTVEGIKEGSSGNNLAKDVCCTAKMPLEGIKQGNSGNNCAEGVSCTAKRPLKGILKCPSRRFPDCKSSPSEEESPSTPGSALKRANSKGFNVSFNCQ